MPRTKRHNQRLHSSTLALMLTLLGFGLRAWQLPLNRFHQDEALYAYFARLIASQQNIWLQTPLLDKPPLNYYLTGATIGLFWVDPKNPLLAEFIAKLPHLFAATVSIVVLFQISKRLLNHEAAIVVTALFALAPYAISFATTLFAETLLTLTLLLALTTGMQQRFGWQGLWLSIACALKPTALYFFPILIGLSGIYLSTQNQQSSWQKNVVKFGVTFISGILVLLSWQLLRPDSAPFWATGTEAYNPQRLIRADEVITRALLLASLWQHQFGSLALAVLSAPIVIWGVVDRTQSRLQQTVMLFIITFFVGYLAWHWLIAFNIRDRYFLPLTPFICIVFGWGIYQIQRTLNTQRGLRVFGAVIIFSLLGLSSLHAATAQHPVGGDHGAYDGIARIAEDLRATPTGTVLYDLGLDWHWRFYLYESDIFIAWQPGPDNIAEDIQVHAKSDPNPRYVVTLDLQTEQELSQSLAEVDYQLALIQAPLNRFGQESLRLHQIVPIP